jgi:hypothetical protein
MFSVEGIGWVIRECREDVRLGMTSECSTFWSLVEGLSRVTGRTKAEWSRSEGLIVDTLLSACIENDLNGVYKDLFYINR